MNSNFKVVYWIPISILVTAIVWFIPLDNVNKIESVELSEYDTHVVEVMEIVDSYESPKPSVTLLDILVFEEGFKSKPYIDSEGYLTIGIGTKISSTKGLNPKNFNLTMTMEEAMTNAINVTNMIDQELSNGQYGETYKKQSQNRKNILISMAYQMGVRGLEGFTKMWKAMSISDYETVANEAEDSLWAKKQTINRAIRHVEVLRTDSLEVYDILTEE